MKFAISALFFFTLAFTQISLASISPGPQADLMKTVEEKQARAAQLISAVNASANDRFSNEQDKENAQFAYSGFMARFESLREDREALERKEILPDNETLEKYAKQYDRLIAELNAYLNGSSSY